MITTYKHKGVTYAIFDGYWTLEDIAENPNMIFVFGDNLQRRGKGGQAIIRDIFNTIGLVSKKEPTNAELAFFYDHEYGQNCYYINNDVQRIKAIAQANEMTIVLAAGGYGTGLAMLDKTAPRTFSYMSRLLMDEFGFDNVAALQLYK